MVIKCKGCDGALVFDVRTGKMKCNYCDSMYEVEEFVSNDSEETIDCNVYACTTCGAELSVNGVETSTFCAYCGQPTIIFDRVSKLQKPEKIIPFSITKEEAVDNIRKRLRKGFFVPSEIKNFEVERVVGIYSPYWLYDVKYYDKQKIVARSGKNTYTHYREAESEFKNLTVDASSNLCDESSQRLEPFDMKGSKEFNEAYLSGFYADKYDQTNKELEGLAVYRCRELFNEKVLESVSGTSKKIEDSNPKSTVLSQMYAMLPAWFMTMRYNNQPYTMLVNGQTGKTVGAVPIDKKKVIAAFVIIFLCLCVVCVPIGAVLGMAALDIDTFDSDFIEVLAYIVIGCVSLFAFGINKVKKLKLHIGNTSAKEMDDFAGKRQKGV